MPPGTAPTSTSIRIRATLRVLGRARESRAMTSTHHTCHRRNHTLQKSATRACATEHRKTCACLESRACHRHLFVRSRPSTCHCVVARCRRSVASRQRDVGLRHHSHRCASTRDRRRPRVSPTTSSASDTVRRAATTSKEALLPTDRASTHEGRTRRLRWRATATTTRPTTWVHPHSPSDATPTRHRDTSAARHRFLRRSVQTRLVAILPFVVRSRLVKAIQIRVLSWS